MCYVLSIRMNSRMKVMIRGRRSQQNSSPALVVFAAIRESQHLFQHLGILHLFKPRVDAPVQPPTTVLASYLPAPRGCAARVWPVSLRLINSMARYFFDLLITLILRMLKRLITRSIAGSVRSNLPDLTFRKVLLLKH